MWSLRPRIYELLERTWRPITRYLTLSFFRIGLTRCIIKNKRWAVALTIFCWLRHLGNRIYALRNDQCLISLSPPLYEETTILLLSWDHPLLNRGYRSYAVSTWAIRWLGLPNFLIGGKSVHLLQVKIIFPLNLSYRFFLWGRVLSYRCCFDCIFFRWCFLKIFSKSYRSFILCLTKRSLVIICLFLLSWSLSIVLSAWSQFSLRPVDFSNISIDFNFVWCLLVCLWLIFLLAC